MVGIVILVPISIIFIFARKGRTARLLERRCLSEEIFGIIPLVVEFGAISPWLPGVRRTCPLGPLCYTLLIPLGAVACHTWKGAANFTFCSLEAGRGFDILLA